MVPSAGSLVLLSWVSPSAEIQPGHIPTPSCVTACADIGCALRERAEKAGAVLALGGDLDPVPPRRVPARQSLESLRPLRASCVLFIGGQVAKPWFPPKPRRRPNPRTESLLDPRFGAATVQWGSFSRRNHAPGSGRRHDPEHEFTRVNEGPGDALRGPAEARTPASTSSASPVVCLAIASRSSGLEAT